MRSLAEELIIFLNIIAYQQTLINYVGGELSSLLMPGDKSK